MSKAPSSAEGVPVTEAPLDALISGFNAALTTYANEAGQINGDLSAEDAARDELTRLYREALASRSLPVSPAVPPDSGAGIPELIIRVRYEGSPIADVRDERGQHLQVLSVSDVPAAPELAEGMLVSNLAMLVRRLAASLRRCNEAHDLPGKAMAFIEKHGLHGSVLRATYPVPSHDDVRRVEGLPYAILNRDGAIVEHRNADGSPRSLPVAPVAAPVSGARTPDVEALIASLQAEAKAIPVGDAFHGGSLHDAPIYDVYQYAIKLIRRHAPTGSPVPPTGAPLPDEVRHAMDHCHMYLDLLKPQGVGEDEVVITDALTNRQLRMVYELAEVAERAALRASRGAV